MSIKVCWTIMRIYDKKKGVQIKDDVMADLDDMGVPKQLIEKLEESNQVQWHGMIDNTETFIGLNLIDE